MKSPLLFNDLYIDIVVEKVTISDGKEF